MAKQSDGQSYNDLSQVAGNELGSYNSQAKSLRSGRNRQTALGVDSRLVQDEEGMAYYNFLQGNGSTGSDVADLSIDSSDWE